MPVPGMQFTVFGNSDRNLRIKDTAMNKKGRAWIFGCFSLLMIPMIAWTIPDTVPGQTEIPASSLSDGGNSSWIQTLKDSVRDSWNGAMDFSASTSTGNLIQPSDFSYVGAFRLPDGGPRPLTFEYGGGAMTFNPAGDPSGPHDGFPGSLFIMGHNRMPYDELPDGNQVAEVSIPVPMIQSQAGNLNTGAFIQEFRNVAGGYFTELNEIPRVGMVYLNHPSTGAKIHLSWGQHFQETESASHAWFSPSLSSPNVQGMWFIGNQSLYSVNDYLFEIPAIWADNHVGGRYLATGRFRDGGWSGMGPALFAYCPWIDSTGTPAPSGARLQEKTLLLYDNSYNTESIERSLQGYQHTDEWSGGEWITTSSGKTGVLFAGTKGIGAKYWYGYINPSGSQYPCVDAAFVGQFPVCRLADGQPCPQGDLTECADHTSERGWWSSRWDARMIFYDPEDLAKVAAGALAPWEPQPYSYLSVHDRLFLNPSGIDPDALGSGEQRRNIIGDVAFDRASGLLYVLELFADQAKPVVHVWRIMSEPMPTACSATIDNYLSLHIPVLSCLNPSLGVQTFWADFVYEYNPMYPSLLPFKLTRAGVLSNPSFSCAVSTLSDDFRIHIPDVLFPDGTTRLWADLQYCPSISTDEVAYFTVTNYGVVSD